MAEQDEAVRRVLEEIETLEAMRHDPKVSVRRYAARACGADWAGIARVIRLATPPPVPALDVTVRCYCGRGIIFDGSPDVRRWVHYVEPTPNNHAATPSLHAKEVRCPKCSHSFVTMYECQTPPPAPPAPDEDDPMHTDEEYIEYGAMQYRRGKAQAQYEASIGAVPPAPSDWWDGRFDGVVEDAEGRRFSVALPVTVVEWTDADGLPD